MRRTFTLLITLAALAFAAPAAAATPVAVSAQVDGQQRQVEAVDGRFFIYAVIFRTHTEVRELKAWDFEPGSAVSLTCTTPGCKVKSVCPQTGCTDPTRLTGAGGTKRGMVDFSSSFRGVKLAPGTTFVATLFDRFKRYKRVTYTVQRRKPIERVRDCSDPSRPGDFRCARPCDASVDAVTGISCNQLGSLLPTTLGAGAYKRTRARGATPETWRVTRLQLRDVPADAFVETFCLDSACPFHLHLTRTDAARPTFDATSLFKRRKLPKGTVVSIAATQNDQVGRSFTWTLRGSKPKPKAECITPQFQDPVAC